MLHVFRRSLLTILAATLTLAVSGTAAAKDTLVTSVSTFVSPSQPAPGDLYTVRTTLRGSTGTPCTVNVTAEVAGLSQSRSGLRLHANQPVQLTFSFNLAGLASGTDLTPTIRWSGCGTGATSSISGGGTPPTVQTVATPALSLSKSLSGTQKAIVSPGDFVTYRLEYASTGTATANSVVLTDTLDSRLSFESATGGASVSGQTVTWNLGDLDPGTTNSVELTARVGAGVTSGFLDNTGTISALATASVGSNTVRVTVDDSPNIQLFKTIDDDLTQAAVLEAGRTITYRIAYENLGGSDADNVVITDVLPAQFVGTPALGGGLSNTFDTITRTASWNLGTVPRKLGGVVTLTAQIDPAAGGVDFENEAVATFTGGASNVSRAHITVAAEPYLLLNKRVQPTLVSPGETVSYLVEYSNIGSLSARQPVFRDTLPAGLTPVPGSFSGTYDPASRTLEWVLPDIAPGSQSHTLSYQATIDGGVGNTDLINQVTATASNLPGILTATASAKVQVREEPVLVPRKLLAPGSSNVVRDGEQLTFLISVENTGAESTSGGITIADDLQPGLSFVSASAGGVESSPGVVTWNLADVTANSQSGVVRLTVEVDGSQLADGDFIANAVSVTAEDQFGRRYSESSNHVVVQYNAPPRVQISKTASPPPTTPVFPGDIIDYTITATLQSLQGIGDLRIADILPPSLEFLKVDGTAVTVSSTGGNTIVEWPATPLASGSLSVTLQARVRAGTPPGVSITNFAAATYNAGRGFASPSGIVHYVADAAVSLQKSRPADQAEVVDGEEIGYEITYTNSGRVTLTDLTLRDVLPDGMVLVSAAPSPTRTTAGPPTTLEWDLPPIDAGRSNTVIVRARVDGAAAGKVLTNQSQISSSQAQPQSASVTSVVRAAPNVTLTKTVNASNAHPGDSIEYTISYANTGQGDALNVALLDSFPAELNFVSASDQVTPSSGVLLWNLGTLAPGDSGSKTVRATVPAGTYSPALAVTNRSDIVSDKTSATASSTVSLTNLPALSIDKTVDRTHASPGDVLRYTLNIRKTGGAATSVAAADLLSPNVEYVAGSSNMPLDPASDTAIGLLVWELGDLPAGPTAAPINIFFDARVASVLPDGTPLRNLATAGANEVAPVLSNEVTTVVDSAPVLTISKTASVATLLSPTTASGDPGDTITYSISVENTGNAPATGVTVNDTLPGELLIDPGSTSANIVGQTATWTIPTLRPGAPTTLTIAARIANDVPDGTVLRNTASVQSNMAGVGGAVSAPLTTIVTGQPRLTLGKQASASAVRAGEQLTYTLSYRNEGTADSGTITIEDVLPPEVSFVSASNGGSDSGGGHVTWTLPSLSAGQRGAVTVTVEVDPVIPNNTVLRNTARIWEGGNVTTAVVATFTGVQPIVSSLPVLEIDKSVSKKQSKISAGDRAVFEIAYRNVGSDTATNVEIIDVLSSGLSLVSATGSPSISGNTITWRLPSLPAQTAGTLLLTAEADAALANGKVLTNSATISAVEQPQPRAASAAVTVLNEVLSLSKTADRAVVRSGVSATATPGDTLTYTLSYENSGGAAAGAVTVTDVLPADVTFVSATPAPASVSGRSVSWDLGPVAAKSTGQLVLVTRVGDDLRDGTVLHNTASISSTISTGTAATPVDVLVSSQPELDIIKTSKVRQASPGQTFAYDITVSNIGSDTAQNVTLNDTLPPETSFISATDGGTHSAGVVTWTLGTLQPNSSYTVHVEAQADTVIANGTPLLNTASVQGQNSAAALLPPVSSSLLLPVTSSPILDIDYSVDQPTVQPGGALLYTIIVRNTGNDTATNAAVSALLPAGTAPQSIDSFGAFVGNEATWNIGSLPPSGQIDLQFSVRVLSGIPDGASEISVATIVADNAPAAAASTTTVVSARPSLVLSKTAPGSVNAGDSLTYALDYFNQGNAAAFDLVIEDNLPAGTSFVAASNNGIEVSPGVVRWNLGALAPLAGGRVTVEVATVSGVNDGSVITNVASASSTGTSSAVAQATTIERSHTELEVTITAAQDPVAAGAQEVLTVAWTNTGNQDTTNALVTATVPPDTGFVSATGGGSFDGTGLVTFNVGNLPAGASGSATITLNVASPLANGTVLKSIASIRADNGLPDSDSVPFMVSSTPVIVASKSVSAARVDSGGTVVFTIALKNFGSTAATGVSVTDALPAGLQVLRADSGGTVDKAANRAVWNVGAIAAGAASANLPLTAQVQAANRSLTNIAEIASAELPALAVRSTVEAGEAQPVPVLPGPMLYLLAMAMLFLTAAFLRRAGVRVQHRR